MRFINWWVCQRRWDSWRSRLLSRWRDFEVWVERSALDYVGSCWIVLCIMLKKGKRVSVGNFLSRRGCLIQESSYSESGDRELMKCVGSGCNLKFNGNQDSGHDSWSEVPYIFGSTRIRA